MSLDSLPNEILLYIINSSAEPNILLSWLTLYKKSYQLCLENKLIEKMKTRFIKTLMFPDSTLQTPDRIDIVNVYPNGEIIRVKRYSKDKPNFFEHNDQEDHRYVLDQHYEYGDNGLSTLVTYSNFWMLHTTFERTIEIRNANNILSRFDIHNNSGIQSICRYKDGKPHGQFEIKDESWESKKRNYHYDEGELISYDDGGITITFDPANYYYANFTYQLDGYNITVTDGTLITFVKHNNTTYYHDYNNLKHNINLKSGRGKLFTLFYTWMERSGYPIEINNEGMIVRKLVVLPVFNN